MVPLFFTPAETRIELPATRLLMPVPKWGTSGFRLGQNTPNPFSNETEFSYQLPEDAKCLLQIFNALGACVFTSETRQTAGIHTYHLDTKDFSRGVYSYQLTATGENRQYRDEKRMVILK